MQSNQHCHYETAALVTLFNHQPRILLVSHARVDFIGRQGSIGGQLLHRSP
jgi:hypothetical protein